MKAILIFLVKLKLNLILNKLKLEHFHLIEFPESINLKSPSFIF